MSLIDWVVFLGFLAYVVFDGVRRGRGAKTMDDYFAGGRSIPWWAAGLSIMATQASAITVIGTTGLGCESGMEFVQIYFGLAFAMVLLSIFFVPLYRGQPILTAYQFLEGRFGPATRTLASLIFMVSRCLAFGVVLYVPGVVLSALLDVPRLGVRETVLIVGALTTVYTMLGGVKAVIATDVKQMVVILLGLGLVFVLLLMRVVPELGFVGSLDAMGAAGKLNAVEFTPESLDFVPHADGGSFWNDKYNFWSGTFGGLFLMLAYFGCDQTQVQRILTNQTADESRKALLLSAVAKVPMQAMVLFIGALLFLFYVLEGSPLFFDPADRERAASPAIEARIEGIRGEFATVNARRAELARTVAKGAPSDAVLADYRRSVTEVDRLRSEARRVVLLDREANRGTSAAELQKLKTPKDTNYIFPAFILDQVPIVLLGLIMASIFAAMMSSADSALNALTSSSVVDIYKRWIDPDASESKCLRASRVLTVFWGVSATGAALLFEGSGSVIEVVNRVGSFFYGSLLGIFVLAMAVPRAGALAGFVGLLGGMGSVLLTHLTLKVEFLWYNVIGCVGVLVVGGITALFTPDRRGSNT